ncbi:MAG: PAS domain S-box protein, partial [Clostridia bacterium]|nr:PAS domain S-box protein [Clostridia bacterium]
VEQVKVVSDEPTKKYYPVDPEPKDISDKANTYIGAEDYAEALLALEPGEIYVSDVIGAYVGTHFVGMYTPKQMIFSQVNAEVTALNNMLADMEEDEKDEEIAALAEALAIVRSEKIRAMPVSGSAANPDNLESLMAQTTDAAIKLIDEAAADVTTPEIKERIEALKTRIAGLKFNPYEVAFAGEENPLGKRFEGIVRWATPVVTDGQIVGYVSFALNHDHIMEFTEHITPMSERYTELSNAYEGNYAFIWDYQCRSICHPRHHSIVGYDPRTGDPQVPWLEESVYQAWKDSGVPKWNDFVREANWPRFDGQSRSKKPAPELTKNSLVGLDGRYLNNAPQCTGWMDLTEKGGSGSFYILWSGLYKLTTAAAIPYYTGQYAPSEENQFSMRGFGFVTIGAGLEDFARPATETKEKLEAAVDENLSQTSFQLILTTAGLLLLVVLIAIWLASWLTRSITRLIAGISSFRAGERQFRFNSSVRDEFGTLADSFDEMADSIVASVKNPLSITDMAHRIIYMNEDGLSFCGEKLEDVVGRPYGEHSAYPEKTVYDPIMALEEGREAEIYYRKEKNRYIRGTANHFFNKDGQKIGYIIESVDMTEMVMEQRKLEEQRTLLNQIFSGSPDLIFYMDAEGRFLAVNPRFASVAGLPPEALVGKKAEAVLSPAAAEEFAKYNRQAMEGRKPFYAEEKVIFADGHMEILDAVRTPILESTGGLAGLLGFARNVDARVKMENQLRNTQLELEEAVNEANQANKHKGEFLARMSHEIRTPMNAIIGITNIVQRKLPHDENQPVDHMELRGYVEQIDASSQHLLGLLNDILDISKIEAGRIELSDEPVDMHVLAATVEGIIRPRCNEKNITFITSFEPFTPSTFISDSLRLRQVLINLLGNAVKFTPECGAIEFGMH